MGGRQRMTTTILSILGLATTLLIAFANWRILKAFDLALDSYARIMVFFELFRHKMSIIRFLDEAAHARKFIEVYYKDLEPMIEKIVEDKFKLSGLIDEAWGELYDQYIRCLNEFLSACKQVIANPEKMKKVSDTNFTIDKSHLKQYIDILNYQSSSCDFKERLEKSQNDINTAFYRPIRSPYLFAFIRFKNSFLKNFTKAENWIKSIKKDH
jgi:hypothetical protein